MIVFSIYLLAILTRIWFNGFFGLFNDPYISKRQVMFLFLGKALAVPVFLFTYKKLYGGIDDLDTGKFYHDAQLLYEYGKQHLGFLVRLLSGLQDDTPGSSDYEAILKDTVNWDNGTAKDYLYNDNRVLIRLHVVLSFLTFGSYQAHALFSCFLSFIGLFFLYKTFRQELKGKGLWALLILCFFPSLWFYTGALLKEGLTIFVLGSLLYQLRQALSGNSKVSGYFWLICLLLLSVLLKPYLLLLAALCFGSFFILANAQKIKYKIGAFLLIILSFLLAANLFSIIIKDRSLVEAAARHQRRFIGISKGGIFLSDTLHFVRLSNDTSQIKRMSGKKNIFTIKENSSYMYWRSGYTKDTLYCLKNEDTTTTYQWLYTIQTGNSNITLPQTGMLRILAACWYYTLFHPLFYNARSAMQVLASLENLSVITALIVICMCLVRRRKEQLLPLAFLVFALLLCLLIGFTAPNSGAIFRYRSPAMLFLLLAALYDLNFSGRKSA